MNNAVYHTNIRITALPIVIYLCTMVYTAILIAVYGEITIILYS